MNILPIPNIVQQRDISTVNSNRNIFTEPSFVQIGIGIVHEFQNLGIEIGIVYIRWEVF